MVCSSDAANDIRSVSTSLLLSSSGRRRDVKALPAVAEDTPPHVPWRVSSLPPTALVGGDGRRSGRARNHPREGGETDPPSFPERAVVAHAAATTAVSPTNGACGRKWMHISNTTLLRAASSAVCDDDSIYGGGVDASCPSPSGSSSSSSSKNSTATRPSKMTAATTPSHISKILVAGRIFDESSSCNSTLAARAQTEVVGAALREHEASISGHHQGLPRVLLQQQQEATSPCVTVLNTPTHPSLLSPAPPAPMDVAPCDRREWRPTPRLITRRHARGTSDQSRGLTKAVGPPRQVVETELNGCSAAAAAAATCPTSNDGVCEARHASRVPAPPRQKTYPPRPIWAALRNRTLKATRQDPSIFRGKTRSELGNGTNVLVSEDTSRPRTRWHILNRRVFGVREVPRSGATTVFPEWMVFSGGVPPSGLDERSRWELRINVGRNRK